MKMFFLIISVFVVFVSVNYVREVNRLERLVFLLYRSGFEKYLKVNENFEIEYDKEKIKDDFKEEGYCLQFKEGVLNFEISFKKFFSFNKEYIFYLEENYEFK